MNMYEILIIAFYSVSLIVGMAMIDVENNYVKFIIVLFGSLSMTVFLNIIEIYAQHWNLFGLVEWLLY